MRVLVDEDAFEEAGEPQRRKLREHAGRLEDRPFLGNKLRDDLVPDRFADLPNLFRLELPEGWRALYTVASHPTEGRAVKVVWVGDHTAYDRLLGYG